METSETITAVTGMLVAFGLPILIVAIVLAYKYRRMQMTHETVVRLLEKGLPVPQRGAARGVGARRAGDRVVALFPAARRGVVDRAHPVADGDGAAGRLVDRIEDAQLIVAAVERGDRGAFAELVRRHQSRVRTLLRRLARGDAALADDLAQEAFVLAWRNLRHFRFEAQFSTWIYRIAFNAWQSEARKRRELLLGDEEGADLDRIAEAAPQPDTDARLDLERAMDVLSDGERAAIAACYYADLSHEEAAKALGIPLGTVKTHILRAKSKLKARLAPAISKQTEKDK
jgi:RNA polymerase sigma-70 factor (ECF subfamily)